MLDLLLADVETAAAAPSAARDAAQQGQQIGLLQRQVMLSVIDRESTPSIHTRPILRDSLSKRLRGSSQGLHFSEVGRVHEAVVVLGLDLFRVNVEDRHLELLDCTSQNAFWARPGP